MKVKTFVPHSWQHVTMALTAIGVFCFWLFLYPFIPVMREASLLFLWNTDYLTERLAIPGGLAQYLGEAVTQLFLNPFNAAVVYAVVFVVTQLLTRRLTGPFLQRKQTARPQLLMFAFSLMPPVGLWLLAMLPQVPLTLTVAVMLVMGTGCGIMRLRSERARLLVLCAMIPVVYWLTGPAAVLLTLCRVRRIHLTATLFVACLVGSSYLVPYPLRQIARGIDYYWSGMREMGTYEEMECDMLIRQKRWDRIQQRFPSPVSPAVRSAVILASYQSGQISYQELMSKIVVPVEDYERKPSVFCVGDMHFIVYFGSVSSAFVVSDMSALLGWPAISQRAAFDAMEYIPNLNKSARALKQLTEACIITGQQSLARKYLSILEETTFYRSWAREMRSLVDNPKLIEKYPFMKKSQEKYANTEDIFFI